MEGFSVDEAAAVLGVPQARVWELLARGVLAGADRSGDMRVFLRSEPPPAPSVPVKGNGNGAEASAFRELLTEFRNLTERYGQALLALGEARGEVASLRGRVELLEARMEQRSPGPMAPASYVLTDSDESALPEEEAVEPVAEEEAAEPVAEVPAAAPPRKARRRTASFDAALARAQDPTPSSLPDASTISLPGAREAAAALADLRGDGDAGAPEPPAKPIWQPAGPPPAALVAGPYSAVVEEPDWIAEEDLLGDIGLAPEPPVVTEASAAPEAPVVTEASAAPEPPTMSVTAAEWAGIDDEPESTAAADEFETATPTWQTVVPPLPPLFAEGSDPLSQVAADQGWAPEEVEAMREMLAGEEAEPSADSPDEPPADPPAEPPAEPPADLPDEPPTEAPAPPKIAPSAASEPAAPPPPPVPAPTPRRTAPRRRSATQRATRRLRRLFGG